MFGDDVVKLLERVLKWDEKKSGRVKLALPPVAAKTSLTAMRIALITALLCVAHLVSFGADAPRSAALRQQFLESKAKAEKGDARAQLFLANCYLESTGVKKDYTEAVKWLRKAAEQNIAQAHYLLGLCYHTGNGVAKNYTEAVKWLRKAAEQNDAHAQAGLGYCYYQGKGVEKDHVEACAWLNLGAKSGEDAASERDALVKQLSPQQIAEAQKRTSELRTQIEAKLKSGGK